VTASSDTKDILQELLLEIDCDKDIDTDMTALLLQVGVKVIFGQGHRTLGILMMSIISLEVPAD
jgi:hypothetical protein